MSNLVKSYLFLRTEYNLLYPLVNSLTDPRISEMLSKMQELYEEMTDDERESVIPNYIS